MLLLSREAWPQPIFLEPSRELRAWRSHTTMHLNIPPVLMSQGTRITQAVRAWMVDPDEAPVGQLQSRAQVRLLVEQVWTEA